MDSIPPDPIRDEYILIRLTSARIMYDGRYNVSLTEMEQVITNKILQHNIWPVDSSGRHVGVWKREDFEVWSVEKYNMLLGGA